MDALTRGTEEMKEQGADHCCYPQTFKHLANGRLSTAKHTHPKLHLRNSGACKCQLLPEQSQDIQCRYQKCRAGSVAWATSSGVREHLFDVNKAR